MGPDIAIHLRFVDDIPRNPRSGKYQEVICRIKTPTGGAAPRAAQSAIA
jgi:hypothetical protein